MNRIFASAQFREHFRSLRETPQVIEYLKSKQIPMVNPYQAHYYEINKTLSTKVLEKNNIAVPLVYTTGYKKDIQKSDVQYPCIIKPNCGGRTNYTFIVHSDKELEDVLEKIPDIEMIVEEFMEPSYGYLTRIEVIDEECKLILKRGIAVNGLSAYHLGVKYQAYTDCPENVKNTALRAMKILEIESGSMDIIENEKGFYIIDVNSVSNASEDNTEMFQFDLMKEIAKYVVKKYKELEVKK